MSEKILIVHNYYQIPGGEDVVVANEKKLLEEHGHEVILYTRDNKEINEMGLLGKLGLFFTTIYNRRTYKEICELVTKEKIDVIHVHNMLNLISPAVFYAAKKCGVPVVNTIHNFRMLCPRATLYRNGKICEVCIKKGLECAIAKRCYRGSLSQTFVCVLASWIHRARGIYKYVNYICLTDFNKDKLLEINGGQNGKIIYSEKVYVKPNFMDISDMHYIPESDRDNYVLYAGRLDETKGIDILLEACGKTKIKVLIAGSGPMEDLVKSRVDTDLKNSAEYLGMLSHEEVVEYMKRAKALVLPTRWYEGFPMSIAESFSVGTPVIGPDMGNVGNIVKDGITGYLFKNGDVNSLTETINIFAKEADVSGSPIHNDIYLGAFEEFESKYNSEINYTILRDIYNSIMGN